MTRDPRLEEVRKFGKSVGFGATAGDYAEHRPGFPPKFFARLKNRGHVARGGKALDLGTGTGTVARGLAQIGLDVTAVDVSRDLIARARELDRQANLEIDYVEGRAEELNLDPGSLDAVTAGQCWHWFERAKVASLALAALKPNGRLIIANFDWLPLPGSLAEATERLIGKHNPAWNLGGGTGVHPSHLADLAEAGFSDIECWSFDLDVGFTPQGWRGRVRASAGVGGSLKPGAVAAFDAELEALMEKSFPGKRVNVLHRCWTALGVNRSSPAPMNRT